MSRRYVVLDSWRGICAYMVAFHHFRAYCHPCEWPVVVNGFMFVDFFFVLSGFVIAGNYFDRLANGFSPRKFAALRFGRLYPLHLATLLPFLLCELALLAIGSSRPAFTGQETLSSLVSNLLLLQAINLHDGLTWNYPSWSIGAEFYTYLIFALIVLSLKARSWIALVIAAMVGCALLFAWSPRFIDATSDYGLIRCIYGFSIGALLWIVGSRHGLPRKKLPLGPVAGSCLEFAVLAGIVAFVHFAGHSVISLASPFVFAVAVFLFAHEGGIVSRLLMRPGFVLLGTLSYSIYLVHAFVTSRVFSGGLPVLERVFGTPLTIPSTVGSGRLFGTSLWMGDGLLVLYALAVCIIASMTYRFIEVPTRAWFRKIAGVPGEQNAPIGAFAARGRGKLLRVPADASASSQLP